MTETEWMLTSLLDCKRVDLYTGDPQLDSKQAKAFKEMRDRRKAGEPLQYICGTAQFANITLTVDPRVLIPRPETEQVVDYALNLLSPKTHQKRLHILDCGTGSGNISIYFAKNLNNISVVSVDISKNAVECARFNAALNNVDDKINFKCEDMMDTFKAMKEEGRRFDLIISNPPYIKTDDLKTLPKDVQYEPSLALDGGVDGCDFYRGIFNHAFDCLSENGMLITEIGETQGDQLVSMARNVSSEIEASVEKDYCGRDRFIVFFRRNRSSQA